MKNPFTRFVRWIGRGVRPVLLGIGAIFGLANVVVDAPPAATGAAAAAANIMSAPAPTIAAPAPATTVTAPAAAKQSDPPAFAGEKASANEPGAAQQEPPLRELSYAGREISRFGTKLFHESGVHVFVGVIVHNLGWSFAWNFAYVALGLLIGAMLLRSAAQFFASLLEGGPAPAI